MNKYSEEHRLFLNKQKKEKRIIISLQFILVCLFLLIWQVFATYSIINTFLYSSPLKVLSTFFNIGYQNLLRHIFITLIEVLISFILSSLIGFLCAALLWAKPILSKVFDPFITILNSLPKVSLGPLFIIWIGAGTKSIIFMAITISVFTTTINIYQGFISVNNDYKIILKSFGANKYEIFTKLIVPINYSNILSTLKINISLCLIGVIMGELLVSKEGIGYLIMYGTQVFQLDLVITCILILAFISYFMYLLIEIYSKKHSNNKTQ